MKLFCLLLVLFAAFAAPDTASERDTTSVAAAGEELATEEHGNLSHLLLLLQKRMGSPEDLVRNLTEVQIRSGQPSHTWLDQTIELLQAARSSLTSNETLKSDAHHEPDRQPDDGESWRVCTMSDLFSRAWLFKRFEQLQDSETQRLILHSYAVPDIAPAGSVMRGDWHVANINNVLLQCDVLDFSVDGSIRRYAQHDVDEGDDDLEEKLTDAEDCGDSNTTLSMFEIIQEHFNRTTPWTRPRGSFPPSSARPKVAPPPHYYHGFNLLLGGDGLELVVNRILSLYSRRFGKDRAKVLPSQRTSTNQPFFQAFLMDGQSLGDAGSATVAKLLRKGLVLDYVSLRHNGVGEGGGSFLASAVQDHRAKSGLDWFGQKEVSVDLRKNWVCDNVGIDVFSNEFAILADDEEHTLSEQDDELTPHGALWHPQRPVDCSLRSTLDKDRACCLVDHFAPVTPNDDAWVTSVAPTLAKDTTKRSKESMFSLQICEKTDLDGRNTSTRGKGLQLVDTATTTTFARCEVISLNPFVPRRGEEPIGDSGVEALASGLFRCHRLRRLDLSFSSISADGLGVLLKALKHTRHLEALILDGNPLIGDDGAKLIGRLLQRRHSHSNLKFISLRQCGITAVGALELTESFNNPHVRRLDLGRNDLGTTGALILAEAMVDRGGAFGRVSYLGLESNGIGATGATALAEAMAMATSRPRRRRSNRRGQQPAPAKSPQLSAEGQLPCVLDLEHNDVDRLGNATSLANVPVTGNCDIRLSGNPITNRLLHPQP